MSKNDLVKKLDVDLEDQSIFQRDYDGMEYLAGYFVLHNANKIFGHDKWGYEVLETSRVDNGANGAFISRVKVWVEGFKSKTDVGTGEVKKTKKGVLLIDTAVKSSVTDGVKRALRSYGKQFGLGLYDSEDILPVIQRELTEKELKDMSGMISGINKIESKDDLQEALKAVKDTTGDRNKQQNLYLKQLLKKAETGLND